MMTLKNYAINPYSDFRLTYLKGADLSGANLRGSDFRMVNLSGANLSNANLRNSSLRGADLSGADLSGTDLSGTDLRGADLSGTDLRIAWFWETKVTADQLMWLTLSGQITPDQASQCKVQETQLK